MVVILHLFGDIGLSKLFIQSLKIISISTNVYRLYACDLLGLYILLVNNSIDPIKLIPQPH